MRPKGGAAVLEARRRRALVLLAREGSLNAVARRMDCAPSSVMRWRDAVAKHGTEGLRVHTSPGRPRKLTAAQQRRLVKLLRAGPLAHGYRTDLWTTPRIAALIQARFGVSYHPDHVGRLLHQWGWTPQKPERRALQRDEAAIARWKQRDWARVKKTPRGWAPTSSSSTNRASS
jgi:transposase